MLAPARRKHRKDFRGRRRGLSLRGSDLSFGEFGLKALGVAWMSSSVIEAGRRAITNSLKRKGKVWIRVFPDKPVTGRPAGQRMGQGKGDIDRYVCVVKPGRIIYEIAGVPLEAATRAFEKAGSKMPFGTKVVVKE